MAAGAKLTATEQLPAGAMSRFVQVSAVTANEPLSRPMTLTASGRTTRCPVFVNVIGRGAVAVATVEDPRSTWPLAASNTRGASLTRPESVLSTVAGASSLSPGARSAGAYCTCKRAEASYVASTVIGANVTTYVHRSAGWRVSAQSTESTT